MDNNNSNRKIDFTLYLRVILFSLPISILLFFYIGYSFGQYDLGVWNKALAWTAVILTGLSMILSGICYFWNFARPKIIYRKQLGFIGFFYALFHFLITFFLLQENFPFPSYYFHPSNIFVITLGVMALLIFFGMTLIALPKIFNKIGGKNWRRLLRIGYIAYIFIIFHFAIDRYKSWLHWLNGEKTDLPPIGLPIFIFALSVIVMRIALEIHKRFIRKNIASTNPTSSLLPEAAVSENIENMPHPDDM